MNFLILALAVLCLCFGLAPSAHGILNAGTLALTAVGGIYFILYLAGRGILPKKQRTERWAKNLTLLLTICLLILGICHSVLLFAFARLNPPPEDTPATVIVLGCQLIGDQPSEMLARRLDTAAAYLERNPQAVCVVSGGQGENDTLTEAQVMYSYLLDKGIAKERLYQENRSENTRQNLAFSMEIIHSNSLPSHAVIATDGFHQLRAYIYAHQAGLFPIHAVSGRTPLGILPAYAVREFFAVIQALLYTVIY